MATTGLPPSVQWRGVARSSPRSRISRTRGKPIVHSPDTLDTERIAWSGRHRLAPGRCRTAALRAALVVGVLLATALLGLATAGALGLTGLPLIASDDASARGASDVLPVAPEYERTVDMHPPA